RAPATTRADRSAIPDFRVEKCRESAPVSPQFVNRDPEGEQEGQGRTADHEGGRAPRRAGGVGLLAQGDECLLHGQRDRGGKVRGRLVDHRVYVGAEGGAGEGLPELPNLPPELRRVEHVLPEGN